MRNQVVVISNMDDNTYFFSTDHCQKHGLGDSFVSCTHTLPSRVVPRKGFEDGIIRNVNDLVAIFYHDMQEIPNPDNNMQPTF